MRSSNTEMSSRSTSRHGDRRGLVRGGFHHGSKSEEVAASGLGEQHLLPILIDQRHAHGAFHDDKGAGARLARFIDALPFAELTQLYLAREHGKLIVIEQREKWNVAKFVGVARHGEIVNSE